MSDIARRTHSVRGPLEGLPILLKDNIDVAGMPTTASSIVLEKSVPDKDAFVVKRLKAAGAVILGKVNLTEFAAWVSNNQSSGNGSLHGQVLNPYDTSTDPGGSSSGSGVAAAAGLGALVIGSDTEGSILSPAGQNGVVGIRPTTGLWSRTGVVPISESQDTLGPMTQTTSDAALLLNALTAVDPEDPHTADTAQVAGTDYLASLKPTALQGARIGVTNSNNAQYVAAAHHAGEPRRDAGPDHAAELPDGPEPADARVPPRPQPLPQAAARERADQELRRGLGVLPQSPAGGPEVRRLALRPAVAVPPREARGAGGIRGRARSEIPRARTYLNGLLDGNNVDAVLQSGSA